VCLVVLRSVDPLPKNEAIKDPTISSAVVMGRRTRKLLGSGGSGAFPGAGAIIAFESEFVSTEEEDSRVKNLVREPV